MKRTPQDQGSLFGYISPITGEVSTHPPLCACGQCQIPQMDLEDTADTADTLEEVTV